MSDPSVGTSSNIAKFAAIGFAVVVLGGVAIAFPKLMELFEREKVEVVEGSVTETLEPLDGNACIWTVNFAIHSPNRPEGHIWVLDANIDLGQPGHEASTNHVDGRVWEFLDAELAYELDECPPTPDDVDHGKLEIIYRKKNQRSPNTSRHGF